MGNAHTKKSFSSLDVDRNGELDLNEIHAPMSPMESCSIPSLFIFDQNKEGCLSYKQFEKLDKFVSKLKKELLEERERQPPHPHGHAHGHHGESSAGLASPMKASYSNTNLFGLAAASAGGSASSVASSAGAPAPVGTAAGAGSAAAAGGTVGTPDAMTRHRQREIVEVRKLMAHKLSAELDRELWNDRAGRQKFLEWLFRLTDTHDCQMVSREELSIVLDIVRHDGIDLSTLAFDGDGSVDSILNEYDHENLGYLRKDEFFELGDLVFRQYYAMAKCPRNSQSVVIGEDVFPDGGIRLSHILGKGAYGVVRHGVVLSTGMPVAVKVISRGNCSDMSKVDNEINAMKRLQHPNVVQLFDVVDQPDDQNIFLVMELCGGGSLQEYVNPQQRPLPLPIARYYFVQLIHGLQYCHQQGVAHRDLRLENLLLDNDGHLKITDFGQCRIFRKGWDVFGTSLTGSLYHLSPEQTSGKPFSGRKVDVWSAGVILYALLTGHLPFFDTNVKVLFDSILVADYTPLLERRVVSAADFATAEQMEEEVESLRQATALLKGMLCVDAAARMTLDAVLAHSWCLEDNWHPALVEHRVGFICSSRQERKMVLTRCLIPVLEEFSVHLHEACAFDFPAAGSCSTAARANGTGDYGASMVHSPTGCCASGGCGASAGADASSVAAAAAAASSSSPTNQATAGALPRQETMLPNIRRETNAYAPAARAVQASMKGGPDSVASSSPSSVASEGDSGDEASTTAASVTDAHPTSAHSSVSADAQNDGHSHVSSEDTTDHPLLQQLLQQQPGHELASPDAVIGMLKHSTSMTILTAAGAPTPATTAPAQTPVVVTPPMELDADLLDELYKPCEVWRKVRSESARVAAATSAAVGGNGHSNASTPSHYNHFLHPHHFPTHSSMPSVSYSSSSEDLGGRGPHVATTPTGVVLSQSSSAMSMAGGAASSSHGVLRGGSHEELPVAGAAMTTSLPSSGISSQRHSTTQSIASLPPLAPTSSSSLSRHRLASGQFSFGSLGNLHAPPAAMQPQASDSIGSGCSSGRGAFEPMRDPEFEVWRCFLPDEPLRFHLMVTKACLFPESRAKCWVCFRLRHGESRSLRRIVSKVEKRMQSLFADKAITTPVFSMMSMDTRRGSFLSKTRPASSESLATMWAGGAHPLAAGPARPPTVVVPTVVETRSLSSPAGFHSPAPPPPPPPPSSSVAAVPAGGSAGVELGTQPQVAAAVPSEST